MFSKVIQLYMYKYLFFKNYFPIKVITEYGAVIGAIWASLVAPLVKNLPAMQETLIWFLGYEDPWRMDRLPTSVFLAFPGGSVEKESTCNAGDLGSIPGLGRSPGGGHGNLLQYSCLENHHGQRRLVGCSPWGCKDSNRTDRLSITQHTCAIQ